MKGCRLISLYAETAVSLWYTNQVKFWVMVVVIIQTWYSQSAGNSSHEKVTPLTNRISDKNLILPISFAGKLENWFFRTSFLKWMIPIYLSSTGSSETERENLLEFSDDDKFFELRSWNEWFRFNPRIRQLKAHCPQHRKPITDGEWGYYLAGLIEGDGSIVISKGKAYIFIAFHQKDVFLAYYIKRRLGYGSIVKQKNKRAVSLVIVKRQGLFNVVNLVNGKLRTKKIERLHELINYLNVRLMKDITPLPKDTSSVLNNHWLAGFTDADGSFQVRIITRSRPNILHEARLHLKIDQKTDDVLKLIYEAFGGYLGHRAKQDTYYYQSTGFNHAFKVIKYFDCYHLLSSKWLEYRQWRRIYLLVQQGLHRTDEGINKIKKIKKTLKDMRQSEH
uniref:Putative LAGLIDADG protein n=1 Tax=Axinella polypoides TaxID=12959 RepID=A0A0U5CJ37_AXIPO|nr:putative LAGLIDADG protein [Axinella polypoides]